MATLTCPTCRTPFQQGDLICLTCGANLARVRGARADEPVRPEGQQAPQPPQPLPPQGQQYPPQQGQYPPQQGQYPPQQGQYPPQQGQQPPPAQGQHAYQQQPQPPQPIPSAGPPPGAGQGQPPQQQFPPLQPPGAPPYPPQHQAEPYAPAGPQGPPQQPLYEPPPPGQPKPYDQPAPMPYEQPAPMSYEQPGHYEPPPMQYEPPAPPVQYEPPPPPVQYEQPPQVQYEQQPPPPYGGQQGFGQPPPHEPTFDHPSPGQPSPFEQQPYGPGPGGFGPPDMPPRVGPPMSPRPAREETLLPPEGGQARGARASNQAMAESTAAMCPYCEAVLANPAAAQCDNCLRPLSRQQPPPQQPMASPAAPPVLRLQFPNGELQLQLGQHLVLGRDAGQSPVAGTFTQYDNVSRRHTTVWLDQSGTAWCRDERSTNGTFVNGERLPAGVEAPLRDGDSLRLAADVTAAVRLG